MERRRYEEDSSVEDSEDFPLYRTPRLHGGSRTCGSYAMQGVSKAELEQWRDFFHENQLSLNVGFVLEHAPEELPEFMMNLCETYHDFGGTLHGDMDECAVCERTLGTKLRCELCKMSIHPECKESKKVPYPCIPATPMKDIHHPDLKLCTEGIPEEYPLVPAILTKCFHHLQQHPQREEQSYTLELSPADQTDIELLSRKLRQSASRYFDKVPNQVVAGCVLKFLRDIATQLFPETDKKVFLHYEDLLLKQNNLVQKNKVRKEAFQNLSCFSRCRQQTIAALMLHISSLFLYREKNKMTLTTVYRIFGETIPAIRLLFSMNPRWWCCMLKNDAERVHGALKLPPVLLDSHENVLAYRAPHFP